MNRLIRLSRELPAPPPALTLAYTPIRLPSQDVNRSNCD